MRKRAEKNEISVRAIAGSYTVFLGMDVTKEARKGLLGFTIKRFDRTEDESYWLKGFRTFRCNADRYRPGTLVSTWENPIQGFQWGDYTAKPGHKYTYLVVPIYGTPESLVHKPGVSLTISTEDEDDGIHAVYFNRAVAGSQAYARKFGNLPPDVVGSPAVKWLSRGLLEAMIKFIRQARGKGWGLRASVYEFTYIPVLEELRAAIKRGVDVHIIFDNKRRGPGEANRQALKQVGIAPAYLTPRTANPSYISHNKFIILLKNNKPVQVWTGSTNITESGILGHSNVGHIIRDEKLAAAYLDYWNILKYDPTARKLRSWCDRNSPLPRGKTAKRYMQPIFSCRGSLEALLWYAQKMDSAQRSVFLTAAFGINELFKNILRKDKPYLRFILLDKPNKGLDIIEGDKDNRISIGGVLDDNKLEEWLSERWEQEKLTGLNQHVKYIHTKYMLLDPLSDDPMVITGSANFSTASTKQNDENMVIIRGNKRVADMYLGEFMRLYDHFRFRGTPIGAKAESRKGKKPLLYLIPDDSWTDVYFREGHPKQKRRLLFR